jgi:hypothetical protein
MAIQDRFQTIEELEARLELLVRAATSKKKDPLQLDAEAGPILRKRHRQLQIQEYLPAAQQVASHLQGAVQELGAKIKSFVVGAGGGANRPELPSGVDRVYDADSGIVVTIRNMQSEQVRWTFTVGAKGENCVLLGAKIIITPGSPNVAPTSWEEVAWFLPSEPPGAEFMSNWVRTNVSEAMEFLMK